MTFDLEAFFIKRNVKKKVSNVWCNGFYTVQTVLFLKEKKLHFYIKKEQFSLFIIKPFPS